MSVFISVVAVADIWCN